MEKRFLILIPLVAIYFALIGLIHSAFAAPYTTFTGTLLPVGGDKGNDIGTSTNQYNNLYLGGNIINSSLGGSGTKTICVDNTGKVLNSGCPSSGGGSGGGTFSTSTSQVSGQLVNYPNNSTDVVLVGANSSTTAPFWWDPNVRQFYLNGIGTTTQVFTAPYFAATSTVSTSSFPLINSTGHVLIGSPAAPASGPLPFLALPTGNTNSSAAFGSIEFESLGAGNSFFTDNMYYNSGFFHRNTGAADLFYMQSPEFQIRTYASQAAGFNEGGGTGNVAAFKADGTYQGGQVGFGNLASNATNNYANFTVVASSTGAVVNRDLQVLGHTMFTDATGTVMVTTTASTTNQYISSTAKPAGTFLAADLNGKVIATTSPSSASSTLLTDQNLFTGASSTIINFNSYNATTTFATTTDISVSNMASTSLFFANNATTTTLFSTTASSTNLFTNNLTAINATNTTLIAISKIGVGTTSPYAPLSVVGSGGVVAQKYTATGTQSSQPSAFNYMTVGAPTGIASITPELNIESSTTGPTLGVGTIYAQSFAKNNGWVCENCTYDGSFFRAPQAGYTEQLYFMNGEVQGVVSNTQTLGQVISSVIPFKENYANGGTGALGGNCSTGATLMTGCTLVATSSSVTVNGGLSVTGDTRLTQATSTGFTTTTICLTGDICRTTWPTVANSASTTLLGDQNLFTGASTTVSNKFNFGSFAATSTAYGPVIHATSSAITTENIVATSSTTNIDWGKGNQQNVRIGTAAITINFGDYVAGQSLRLIVCNPTGGTAGTITWDPKVLWSGGTAPTQTTTANHCDIWSFIATNGTSTLQVLGGGNITNF